MFESTSIISCLVRTNAPIGALILCLGDFPVSMKSITGMAWPSKVLGQAFARFVRTHVLPHWSTDTFVRSSTFPSQGFTTMELPWIPCVRWPNASSSPMRNDFWFWLQYWNKLSPQCTCRWCWWYISICCFIFLFLTARVCIARTKEPFHSSTRRFAPVSDLAYLRTNFFVLRSQLTSGTGSRQDQHIQNIQNI